MLVGFKVIGLLLQHGQHNFQKTKRETSSKASPQKLTTTARRLTEMSANNKGAKGNSQAASFVLICTLITNVHSLIGKLINALLRLFDLIFDLICTLPFPHKQHPKQPTTINFKNSENNRSCLCMIMQVSTMNCNFLQFWIQFLLGDDLSRCPKGPL